MVKDKVGRSRYVVFTVEAARQPSKRDVAAAIQDTLSPVQAVRIDPRIITFDGAWGILRCSHLHKDEAIAALQSIRRMGRQAVRVRTTGTSGTIRRARRKFMP